MAERYVIELRLNRPRYRITALHEADFQSYMLILSGHNYRRICTCSRGRMARGSFRPSALVESNVAPLGIRQLAFPSALSRARYFHRIYNVRSLIFGAASVDYANTHDHSKWAISVTNRTSAHWVCIADINRAVNIHSFF